MAPGAGTRHTLCCDAGSFIAGYGVASVVFGRLVHFYAPFKLMTVGLLCVLLRLATPHNIVRTCMTCVMRGVQDLVRCGCAERRGT